MDSKVFGQFVAKIRKERGMTQAELGELIGVTDKAISRWERGIGFPDINTLEPLANALDISVFELMRSEKADMGKEKRSISESDAAQLMEHAVEMASENQRRDKVSLWVGGAVLFVIAVLAKMSGHANLGGSLFIGAMAAIGAVALYFYSRNREDRESRRVYGFFLIFGVGASLQLFRLLGVNPNILVWGLFGMLVLLIRIMNK